MLMNWSRKSSMSKLITASKTCIHTENNPLPHFQSDNQIKSDTRYRDLECVSGVCHDITIYILITTIEIKYWNFLQSAAHLRCYLTNKLLHCENIRQLMQHHGAHLIIIKLFFVKIKAFPPNNRFFFFVEQFHISH